MLKSFSPRDFRKRWNLGIHVSDNYFKDNDCVTKSTSKNFLVSMSPVRKLLNHTTYLYIQKISTAFVFTDYVNSIYTKTKALSIDINARANLSIFLLIKIFVQIFINIYIFFKLPILCQYSTFTPWDFLLQKLNFFHFSTAAMLQMGKKSLVSHRWSMVLLMQIFNIIQKFN